MIEYQFAASLIILVLIQEEIKKAVEKVCTIMPASIQSECVSLIEEYGDAIIKLLVDEASPELVCATLGLCAQGDSLCKYEPCTASPATVLCLQLLL